MNNKYVWIGGGILIAAAFLVWLFWASTKPLPGTKIDDLGRGHVQIGTEVKYNSNPPTSGPHYGDWVRAGVYNEPKDDRNLVHSLEHGYIVMSYKCISSVIASPGSESGVNSAKQSTPSGEIASSSLDKLGTPRNDDSEQCSQRKNQLEEIYNKKGKRKLIVVPRPNLDTNFALTAWNYLDKFEEFDSEKVEKFIDTHRDNGPERTME